MGYMVITKNKKEKMADLVEEMLYAGGRLMSCIEELSEDDAFGSRYQGRYGMRDGGRYGSRGRYGMRDDEMDDPDSMSERRYRRY